MADNRNQDIVFKNLAKQYTEFYGNSLLKEKAEIERQKIVYVMPRADSAIKPLIKKRQRGAVMKIVAGIAAAVILAVSIPAILNRANMTNLGSESADAESSQSDGIMPLTFTLPSAYTVADTKLDNGQSVYYLDNTSGDNVVLTMEGTAAEAKYDYGKMGRVYIDGEYVSGLSTADYQILVFEHDGIFYTLSCKYELGTVVELYHEIVY